MEDSGSASAPTASDLGLRCPFTCLVVGPTSSGKTELTRKLLQERTTVMTGGSTGPNHTPSRALWCYSIWQPLYTYLATTLDPGLDLTFHQGLPPQDILEDGNFILIVDDLIEESVASETLSSIFTKYSHHNNISCIYILQNLFPRGQKSRNISLNAHYIFLMKNSRDRAQIQYLARQAFPGKSQFLVDSYADATQEPYSYLMLDFTVHCKDSLRVRTGIFSGEEPVVYRSRSD
jgi:hypothetical protein